MIWVSFSKQHFLNVKKYKHAQVYRNDRNKCVHRGGSTEKFKL